MCRLVQIMQPYFLTASIRSLLLVLIVMMITSHRIQIVNLDVQKELIQITRIKHASPALQIYLIQPLLVLNAMDHSVLIARPVKLELIYPIKLSTLLSIALASVLQRRSQTEIETSTFW